MDILDMQSVSPESRNPKNIKGIIRKLPQMAAHISLFSISRYSKCCFFPLVFFAEWKLNKSSLGLGKKRRWLLDGSIDQVVILGS